MHPQQANHLFKPRLLTIACGWLVCLLITSAPVSAQQYPGIKCIVDGNLQCKVRHAVKFGPGDIFFGSEAGAKRFQTSVLDKLELGQQPEQALLLKANHQLALTKQVKQQRCPITGKSIEKEQHLVIAGVSVFFHDSEAKAKMQAAESTWARAQQVFAPDAFKRNFIAEAKTPPKVPVAVADESGKFSAEAGLAASSKSTR